MCIHAPEDVVEHTYRLINVRALVEHHALGTVAHGRVGDFRARRSPFLGEALEHLSCPDGRAMCGFTDPEDFLLGFSQAFVTAFHGQVAASDHDAHPFVTHRREQQRGQSCKCTLRFDLQNDAGLPAFMCAEQFDEFEHVVFIVHKREADEVRVAHDEVEIGLILIGQRRQAQLAVREIDALVRPAAARRALVCGGYEFEPPKVTLTRRRP